MMPITLQYANSGQKHSSLDTTHTATQDRKTENLALLETHEINNLIINILAMYTFWNLEDLEKMKIALLWLINL